MKLQHIIAASALGGAFCGLLAVASRVFVWSGDWPAFPGNLLATLAAIAGAVAVGASMISFRALRRQERERDSDEATDAIVQARAQAL